MEKVVGLNQWKDKMREPREKFVPDLYSYTTNPIWSHREANSNLQHWDASVLTTGPWNRQRSCYLRITINRAGLGVPQHQQLRRVPRLRGSGPSSNFKKIILVNEMIKFPDETVFPYNFKYLSSTISLTFSITLQCILALCLSISPCLSQVVYCRTTGSGRCENVKKPWAARQVT